jgi:hypothetical protein
MGEKRRKLLYDKQVEWGLKIKAILLKHGDENTKYFYQHANYRKNVNIIWKIVRNDESKANSFEDIASLRVEHFQNIYNVMAKLVLQSGYKYLFLS